MAVFGSRIPLKTMAVLCRSLGTMLHSGLPILKAFDIAARKTGDARCRRVLAEVTAAIHGGSDVSSALRQHGGYFPDLLIDMVDVSEQSGALPEVLAALAAHYDNLVRLRRSFLTAIAWPVIQLVAAILIVAFLIFILGIVAEMGGGKGAKPTDMLGWGLTGTVGAIVWLTMSFGSIAAIVGGYYLVAKTFRQQRVLDGLLLRVPVIGTCMRSFALARFSWAFYLTQQAGMPIGQSLQASLRATGNGAYAGTIPQVCDLVKQGEELSVALDATRLFPEEFLQMVQVAESSGTVPETLERLSPQFEDQARRSLGALAALLGWLVWVVVAGLIVFIIFSIFLRYVGMINSLL